MQNSPNSNVQIALIGAGGMGQGDARYATQLPGVKLVAAADIYDGRLERVREIWGGQVFTTRDHREILNRKDVDAVIRNDPAVVAGLFEARVHPVSVGILAP